MPAGGDHSTHQDSGAGWSGDRLNVVGRPAVAVSEASQGEKRHHPAPMVTATSMTATAQGGHQRDLCAADERIARVPIKMVAATRTATRTRSKFGTLVGARAALQEPDLPYRGGGGAVPIR